MSYYFDGDDDYAVTTDKVFDLVGKLSMSVWVRIPAGHANITNDRIIDFGQSNYDGGFGISYAAGGVVKGTLGLGTGTFPILFSDTLTNNTWYHFAMTSDDVAVNHKGYINGTIDATDTTSDSVRNATWMHLGSKQQAVTQQDSECYIAELCVWDGYILTQADVTNLAAGTIPSTIENGSIISYWPLLTDADDAISTHDLTATGATVDAEHPAMLSASTYSITGAIDLTVTMEADYSDISSSIISPSARFALINRDF